jgi:hypothetical protein
MTAVYVTAGLVAMAGFLLAGAALLAHLLQPAGFVTLSMVAAALLLGSIAKLESGPSRRPLDPRSTSNILPRRG